MGGVCYSKGRGLLQWEESVAVRGAWTGWREETMRMGLGVGGV